MTTESVNTASGFGRLPFAFSYTWMLDKKSGVFVAWLDDVSCVFAQCENYDDIEPKLSHALQLKLDMERKRRVADAR